MRTVHTVTISVFCKEHEDGQEVKDGLLFLLGMAEKELADQRMKIDKKSAKGFGEKRIIILSVTLDKARHANRFLAHLCKLLAPAQRRIIIAEAKSRLDDDLFFYLRFDKSTLIADKKLLLTDRGNCYHVKMSIAAFPKRADVAFDVVRSIFSEDLNTDRSV